MTPGNERQSRDQKQDEADAIEDEEPGLEHAEDAKDNPADQHTLDDAMGARIDAIIEPASDNHNQRDEQKQDADKNQNEGRRVQEDVARHLLGREQGVDHGSGDQAENDQHHGDDRESNGET